jgi:hypothetical protein
MQLNMLITIFGEKNEPTGKFCTVNGFSACPVVIREIASL